MGVGIFIHPVVCSQQDIVLLSFVGCLHRKYFAVFRPCLCCGVGLGWGWEGERVCWFVHLVFVSFKFSFLFCLVCLLIVVC